MVFLFTGGLIAVAAILVYLFWPSGPKPAANVNANRPGSALAPSPAANVNAPSPPRPASEAEKAATLPKTIAVSFAERIDSYSSQSGLKNLDDVALLVTPATWNFINGDYRARLIKTFPPKNAYLGVSARVVSAKQVSFDGQSADYLLGMQEVWSGATAATKYPTMEVTLEKDGDNWLVNNFKWQ